MNQIQQEEEEEIIKENEQMPIMNHLQTESVDEEDAKKPIFPVWKLLIFASYMIALCAGTAFLLAVIFPSDIIEIVGEDQKTVALGVILTIASICSVVISPVSGFVSDKFINTRIGRRKPLVILGNTLLAASVISRTVFVFPGGLVPYALLHIVGASGNTMSNAGFTALLPDLFNKKQTSVVSGFIGFFNIVGNIIGVGVATVYGKVPTVILSAGISVCLVIGIAPVFIIREPPKPEKTSIEETATTGAATAAAGGDDDSQEVALLSQVVVAEAYGSEKELPKQYQTTQQSMMEDNSPMYSSSPSSSSLPPAYTQEPTASEETLLLTSGAVVAPLSKKQKVSRALRSLGVTLLGFIKPFGHWDFFWTFFNRLMFQCGLASIQNYILYFIRDMVGPNYVFIIWDNLIKSPQEAMFLYIGASFLMALPSSVVSGFIADVFGKKYLCFAAGMLSAAALTGMVVFRSLNALILLAGLTGLGMGLYYAVELSLASECLPSKEDSAKDFGIWQLSNTIPSLITAPLAAGMITLGDTLYAKGIVSIAHFGYILQYGTCAAMIFIASVSILLVRKGNPSCVKKKK